MKITFSNSSHCQQNQGSAILIVLILLGAMVVFIASNIKNLNQLKHELDLIEQKQLKRQAANAPQPVAPKPDSNQP